MILLQREQFGWSMWRQAKNGLEQFGAATIGHLENVLAINGWYVSLTVRPDRTYTVRPLPSSAVA